MAGMKSIQFFGDTELLNRLETAQVNIAEACKKAIEESISDMGAKLLDKWNGIQKKHPTGRTARSFTLAIEEKDGVIKAQCGFKWKQGGAPAHFWNVGTPYIQPTHFIDDVVTQNIDNVKAKQIEVLKEFLNVE